ncbi:helix-turn-helix domain-containing protein [Rhodoferax antarcticus]|nr:helix-turn-helix domain-containing protein [Rhodoferax antarcticus]
MAKKVTLTLLPQERFQLQHIIDRGSNWRERERAKTLILFDDGLSMKVIAETVGIDIRTVGLTRMDWLKRGFESLVDAPRSGAPRKITPEQLERLLDAAEKEPLTAKALLAKHVDAGGTLVHLNTLTQALKKAQFVWKRTRSSLKKKETKPLSDLPK